MVVGNTTGAYAGPPSAGTRDAFVTKQDPAADFLWNHQFCTLQQDFAEAVAVDSSSIVYLVGNTAGDLGDLNDGSLEGYVRSYAPAGDVVRWTRQFGARRVDVRSVATDAHGNVFVVGQVVGGLLGQEHISWDFGDAFVTSYDHHGEERWTRQFGTPRRGTSSSRMSSGRARTKGATSGRCRPP